jgi:hypothetical protein
VDKFTNDHIKHNHKVKEGGIELHRHFLPAVLLEEEQMPRDGSELLHPTLVCALELLIRLLVLFA